MKRNHEKSLRNLELEIVALLLLKTQGTRARRNCLTFDRKGEYYRARLLEKDHGL